MAFATALGGIKTSLDNAVSELTLSSVDTSKAYETFYSPYTSGTDSDGNVVVIASWDYCYTTDQKVNIYSNDLLTNEVATTDVDGTGADIPEYDTDTTTYCYFDSSDIYRAIQIDHANSEAVSGGIMAMPQDWIDEGLTIEEGKTEYIYNWGIASNVIANITDTDTTYPDTFAYTCEGSIEEGYTFTVSFVNPTYSTTFDYFGIDSTYGYYDGDMGYSYSATITVNSDGFISKCVSSQKTYLTVAPVTGFTIKSGLPIEDYEETVEQKNDALVAYSEAVPTNPDEVPAAFYGKFYSADGQGHYWIKLMSGDAYVYIYVYSEAKAKDVIDGGASAIAYSISTESIDFSYASQSDANTYAVSLTIDENGDLLVESVNGENTVFETYLTEDHYNALV
jgi:hypothetical protein